ncbi:MAG TPA: hypothetical protein VEI52_03645, partial [Terriglobales bacterium]|nr:hypothetical protein [Terriglobales bacterium]
LEGLVVSAGLEGLVVSAELEERVASVGLEEPVALVGLAGLEGLVESAAGTVHRLCRRAATTGSTTPNIAAVPPIGTGRRRTGLGGQRVVTRWPTVRLVPGARFNGRAVISAATAQVAQAEATVPPAEAWATEREEAATGLAEEAERIASETGTSLAAGAGIGMLSEAVPGDTADRMLAPAATAVPRAWAAGAEDDEVAEEAAGGGGKGS